MLIGRENGLAYNLSNHNLSVAYVNMFCHFAYLRCDLYT